MIKEQQNIVNCSTFEELLTDYLDKTLDSPAHKSVAAHALSCPLCHSLLNDVKESLSVCREIAVPTASVTRLEARVLSMTMPQTAMACEDFEGSLTDYLDGFLPAASFHRWERHAALCSQCEDLPGMVVRSIAACYTYKMEELTVPAGLHVRILNLTLGTAKVEEVTASWTSQVGEWIRGLGFPIGVPQLAPVAMMFLFAFLVFSQTVSADGTLAGVFTTGVDLAEQTYQQSSEAWNGKPNQLEPAVKQDPITGTTDVSNGGNK
ncbi:MAG: anti-sigma factor family protein [Pyrinomonadaceae bacterium]